MLLAPNLALAQAVDDKGYLTNFLEQNLSGAGRTVVITGFEGALSSRATMSEIAISDAEGVWITLRDVTLDWNRSALLTGRLSVNALTAGEILLDRLPVTAPTLPSPEARPFTLPDLPVSVEIGQLAATRIALGPTVLGTALEGRLDADLSLIGGEGTANLVLERTDDGPEGVIRLGASYSNTSRALNMDLSAVEAEGGVAATILNIPGAPAIDLSIVGDGTMDDFLANVALASGGEDRLTGTAALASAADGARGFTVDLAGDLAPVFLPQYAAFFGPEVSLQAEGSRSADGRLDVRTVALSTRALQIDGSLVVAADGVPERFSLTGALGQPGGVPVLLPLTTDQDTRILQGNLALNYDQRTGDRWTLEAALDGLDRADFAADRFVISGAGRIARGSAGQGPVVEGSVDFDATGLIPADPGFALALGTKVAGKAAFLWQDGGPLRLPQIDLTGADYGLTASGLIGGLAQGLPLSGTATVRVDDLTRFAGIAGRPLSGGVTGNLQGGGTLLTGAFDLRAELAAQNPTVGIDEVDGLLAGVSAITLSALRDEGGTTLRQLSVNAQSLTLTAQGKIASAGTDLTADLDFTDLSVMGGPYSGALKAQARVTGTPDAALISLDADGMGLAVGQAQADALLSGPSRLTAEVGVAGTTIDIKTFSVTAANLIATATGQISPDGSDVSANLSATNLAALGGAYRGMLQADAQFQGTLQQGRLQVQGNSTNLGLGVTQTDRLLVGETSLTADIMLTDGIARIDSAVLTNPQISASANGSANLLAIEARLVNLGLLLPDFPGPVTITGTAVAQGADYLVNLAGTGPGQIAARVNGTLAANMARADLTLAGSAQAGLADVFLRPRTISGPVRFDLRLNGPLAPAALSGRVSLAGGRLSDPGLPFSLEGITATADLDGGQARTNFSMGLTTGGTVSGGGSIGLQAPYPADLRANLEQVQVRDPRLYETRLNGDVTVTGPLTGGGLIAGRILLNETELRVPSTGLGAAGQLPGLVHVAEPADVQATRARAGLIADGAREGAGSEVRPLQLDLILSAPERVFVRGRGLDLELGGELRLGGTTAAIVPSGAFELIRGRLDILGKRLVLSAARLQLEGSFDPLLEVLASTEQDGITSSVRIAGPASSPVVSFVSVPELPEEEVLSRLLFGRGLEQLSALQAVQLAGAVATLAGRGGEGIIARLRRSTGLDDLDIQSSEDDGTTVRAGKYLSRNLYSEIVVGDQGQSEIQLNLDVTDSVTLRGSTGDEGGASLGVFLEKDY